MNTSAITSDRWNKDHWSLLGYLETLAVDGKEGVGTIDHSRVRCNEKRHPLLSAGGGVGWKQSYGTRLKGFFQFDKRADPDASAAAGLQLLEHDDWDCLDDLEAAGFVEILSTVNGFFRLTKEGIEMSAVLRDHKARGCMFATFEPAATVPA